MAVNPGHMCLAPVEVQPQTLTVYYYYLWQGEQRVCLNQSSGETQIQAHEWG